MLTLGQLNRVSVLHENQPDDRDWGEEGPLLGHRSCTQEVSNHFPIEEDQLGRPRLSLASRGLVHILLQLLVIWLVIPIPASFAQMVTQAQDVQLLYNEETLPGVESGFWSVFDTYSTHEDAEPDPKLVIEHPACILLKTKLIVRLDNTTIVELPENAMSHNDTCYLPEEVHIDEYDGEETTYPTQSVHLTWSEDNVDNVTDSSLTAVFSSGPRQGNQSCDSFCDSYDTWYWMSRFQLKTPTVTIKLTDMDVFQTPMLFAFACKGKELTFEVVGKVNGQQETLFLSFHHLEIEAFRKDRYYTSMTHLKWDCQVGWPYKNLAYIVNAIIIVVVLVSTVYTYFLCLKSKNETIRRSRQPYSRLADAK